MTHPVTRLIAPLAILVLSGCISSPTADMFEDVERLSEVDVAASETAALAETAPPQGGFLARLLGGGTAPAVAEPADGETALTPAVAGTTARGGLMALFGGRSDQPRALAADEVPPLTQQAFGVVSRTCGVSGRDLGTRIAQVSGYSVYDTIPNSTAPRPHYITGFSDRCARQFTAALVLTGDVGTHEVVRYQTAQSRRPYTEADTAYEAIKASVCRAGHGQPCGAQIDRLARNTTFVVGYEQFASSPTWVEILLHAGDVAAVSVERE